MEKLKLSLSVAALLVAFAAGRFLTPTKVKTVVQTITVEKKVETDDSKKHYVIVVHEIDKPDGTKETTTTKTETDEKASTVTDNTTTDKTQSKEVTHATQKVTLSALGGLSFSGLPQPVYGVSLTKPILGPIAIGGFALTNRTAGVSIGLQF